MICPECGSKYYILHINRLGERMMFCKDCGFKEGDWSNWFIEKVE